jgi:hypothetical protein
MVMLVAAALLLGACRSDGGIGRREAIRGMRWTLDSLVDQHHRDMARTEQNVSDLAGWFEDEVTHPTRGMERTMSLYLEGNTRR